MRSALRLLVSFEADGVEPIKVMKAGGWKDLKTMMIYVRKAGIDLKGMMDGFELHNPFREQAKIFNLATGTTADGGS